jgi:ketosteroid isomerase-like protein
MVGVATPRQRKDVSMNASTKETAASVWRAFASRDPDTIRAALSEDASWTAPARNATQVALGLPADFLESREGVVAFLVEHFRRLFPEGAEFEFTKVVAEGDTVVFEQTMKAVTVNGRDYHNRYCWIFEMDGPRVRRIREYMDTFGGYRMIFGDETPRSLVG